MALFENTLPLTNRQPVKFKCSACGACCKNVRDSILLEPLDAFRIVREYIKNGFSGTGDEILDQIANLKELSRGFDVFVLKTVNDSGVCGMLKDNRCTVYTARPPHLQAVSVYGGSLCGRAYKMVSVYRADPSFQQGLRNRTGMASPQSVGRR